MILHVPQGQWADAVTALQAEVSSLRHPVRPGLAGVALRGALLELGIKVVVTRDTDTPEPAVAP